MKRLSDEYLLRKLKEKYEQNGKSPTKQDIDNDTQMPHSSVYLEHFGGLTKALGLVGLPVNRIEKVTLEKCVELAKEYYMKNNTVPRSKDFDNTPGYPHSCNVRDVFHLKWNEFLKLAELSIYTRGNSWIKNRRAEVFIMEKLKKQGYEIEDLSLKNMNAPYSMIINKTILIDVRYSCIIIDNNYPFWKFNSSKVLKNHLPKYYVCVGGNEEDEPDSIFVIPVKELSINQSIISINKSRIEHSKYSEYLVTNLIHFY